MKITVEWIANDEPYAVQMRNEAAAFELAEAVSNGGDATVTMDDDITIVDYKFEDGVRVDRTTVMKTHVLAEGRSLRAKWDGDTVLIFSSDDKGVRLNKEQARKLAQVINGVLS